jgi:hypothetical protein
MLTWIWEGGGEWTLQHRVKNTNVPFSSSFPFFFLLCKSYRLKLENMENEMDNTHMPWEVMRVYLHDTHLRASSYMRLRARDHYTSSTLISGNGGAGQIRFTLHLRDQLSMWMQDGCKVYMDSYMASNGSCFIVTLDCFHKPPLGGRPNTKLGDQGTPNAHNRWFILIYQAWGHAWIESHWNSIWLRARSHMTSRYTWRSVTTPHDFGGVLGEPLDTFL